MTNYKFSPAQARMIENVSDAQDRRGDSYMVPAREERTARSLIKRGHLQVVYDGDVLRVAMPGKTVSELVSDESAPVVADDTPRSKTLLNVRNFPRRNQRKLAKRLARALAVEGAYKVVVGDRVKVMVPA